MKTYFKMHDGIIPIVLVGLILLFIEIYYLDIFSDAKESPVIKLHAATIIILTLALTIVAWIQLSKLSNTSKADFLLRIDRRYGSEEMIKARKIIHKLYCNIRDPKLSVEAHQLKIAKEIKKIGQNKQSADDFIYLINFLDFLETIAYLEHKKYVKEDGIEELLGGSIVYYFEIYKHLIYYRRLKYNKPNFYAMLENLARKIANK